GGHHELWMSVGGSAGHSGLWGLNIDEGTRQDAGGRRWDVEVLSAREAYTCRIDTEREDKERRQERSRNQKLLKHREMAWNALRKFPEGETMKALRTVAKLNPENFQSVIEVLLEDGLIEPCTVNKAGR